MSTKLDISFIHSISQVEASDWNRVVDTDYPFIQYEFIAELERSGATTAASGWEPQHLLLSQEGELIGIMPLYIKRHSYGEYIFDFQWANAYQQSGLDYYPKLVCAIPFTPVTGRRLYLSGDFDTQSVHRQVCLSLKELAEKIGASSWHVLFNSYCENQQLSDLQITARLSMQYHWFNRQYANFDDFLTGCKSKQRKNIRRERRIIEKQNLRTQMIEGAQISSELWQRFFMFYQMTYIKHSGHNGYLPQSFFEFIGQSLANSIVMSVAFLKGEVVAASLFFKDRNKLYGRYWGCMEEYECLHFELCYYQGIQYCIEKQMTVFDAGAQGEHKIARGFKAIKTHSNHWLAHPHFSKAIDHFIRQEAVYIDEIIQQSNQKLPYKDMTEE